MSFKIGNIKIKNNIVLAPMAGISNPAYIKICEQMQVGYAITELISSEAIVRNNKKTLDMLKGLNNLKIPIAVQIFGSSSKTMANAAKILVDKYQVKIIDINMGCPVPKVAIKAKAGSYLLKDPENVKKIVSEVVKAVSVPVTVKIRIGWDENSINAKEIAQICESSGASAITVHGRTRKEGYQGKIHYDIIKEVKESVNIPVIGNGDIKDIKSALKMYETKVDAIMIGRGALGNPWLIKELVTYFKNGTILEKPSYNDKINMCLKHLKYLLEIKEEKKAILEMRSHIAWYIKGLPSALSIKKQIMKLTTKKEVTKVLKEYQKYLKTLTI